ncbi:MAG: thioredoxin family protein [Cellulosilyticaceae bacterium]
MGLFRRKKEEKKCCCAGSCNKETIENAENNKLNGARIKILGGGCAKCHDLQANTQKALEKLNMDIAIEHITDFAEIATYGIMTTPALVIDKKVHSYGKVLSVDEVVAILEKL